MSVKTTVKARSLQEWMERTGTSGRRLLELVKAQTGQSISPSMLSFILRGSRRCSIVNALAFNAVTGVDTKVLRKWPRSTETDKELGGRSKQVA